MNIPKVSTWSRALVMWLLRISCIHVVVNAHPADTSYGIIIDAGSSGSRARLYSWTPRDSRETLPKFNEFFSKKKKPGISEFKRDNLEGLRPYLAELVDAAKEMIPASEHGYTSIFLMATAGMRLLMEPRANIIMDTIQEILSDPELCPFQFQEIQARILSGEEEGVFGWIAANYLNNYFNDPTVTESSGILELGGASTQIAFVPEGSILADKFPVRLAGKTYPLYVHSYLYMGQNFADLWIKEYLHRERPGETHVMDPCMLKGDNRVENISNIDVTFQGSGEPTKCATLVEKLVFKVEPYQCYPKPCAVGQVYQPTISKTKNFFALSAFTFPMRTLGVLDDNGVFTPADAINAAEIYCQKDIGTIINETGRKPEFLSVECLMGIYVPILFTRGYGFANDTRQVAAKFDINGKPAEWTLGAIIYETERRATNNPCGPRKEKQTSGTAVLHTKPAIYIMYSLLYCLVRYYICINM